MKFGWKKIKTVDWKKLKQDEMNVRTAICGSLGAGFTLNWISYTPPAFPTMANLDKEMKRTSPAPTFSQTIAVINKGITLPAAIAIPTSTMTVAWSPLQPFPSASIPEVAALQTTIDVESKKVTDKVTNVQGTVTAMLSKKFRGVPSWNLTNAGTIIDNIIYNFNTANEIFGNIQNALKQSLDGVYQSITSAGNISVAIKNTLINLPARIKTITDTIAATINANAKTLVSDISTNVSTVVKNLTAAITTEVNRYVSQLSANIGTFLTNLMGAIKSDITTVINDAISRISGIATAVKNDFGAVVSWFTSVLSGFQNNITTNVLNVGNQITTDVQTKVTQFTQDLTNTKNAITAAMDAKVQMVQDQVNKSLAAAKADINNVIATTKADINKSLQDTKDQLAISLADAKKTISDMQSQVTATAESVTQVKVQIAAYADQITQQAKTITQATADIVKIRDDLQSIQSQLSVLQSKKPEASTQKSSIFPFFGIMGSDSLSEKLSKTSKIVYEIVGM